MRTRLGWLVYPMVVGALSCGGGHTAPQRVIANKPAVPSCGDASVVLRGRVETDEKTGHMREAAIANACEIDRWTPDILGCVASSTDPETCLTQLTAHQRESYDAKLAAWDDKYGGDSYGGKDDGDDGSDVADDSPEAYVECPDVVGDPSRYPPAISLEDLDRAWDLALRKYTLLHACEEDDWDVAPKRCLQAATDAAGVNTCITDKLEAPTRVLLTTKLAQVDSIATKGAAARKRAASIDCKKVVAAHYGDAAWKTKAFQIKGKDRTKMIKASRDLMTKACTADQWSGSLRACLVVGGNEACFAAAGQEVSWGSPRSGS